MTSDQTSVLRVVDLKISVNQHVIVDHLNFTVESGDVVAVIGPNGAGKTTLFKALLGLLKYSGNITWRPGVKIGYVPQRMEIETDIPLTIREFLRLRQASTASEASLREAIQSVSLPVAMLDSGLGEISVGQRQRILIAWALLGKPDVLLFDEPTADIDIQGQESIYQLLHHLQDQMKLTIILISHDLNIVYKYAVKVLCLNRTQVCFGLPEDVLTPQQLQQLYGGEHTFYHHLEGHQH